MKTTGEILKEAMRIQEKAQKAYNEEIGKLEDALAVRKFAFWAGWNCLSLVWVEKMLNRWNNVVYGLQRLIEEGKTSEDIVDYIKGYREQGVSAVMNSRTAHSSNLMSNEIDNLEQDVEKAFAGRSLIDTDSMAAFIHYCGGKV